MRRNSTGSFFARLREKFFKWNINCEIFDELFPHLEGEEDFGYQFATDEEMNQETARLDVQLVLDRIEDHIRHMPKAYGECFRHIMHRDLHEVFRKYEREAKLQRNPDTCKPQLVANLWGPRKLRAQVVVTRSEPSLLE